MKGAMIGGIAVLVLAACGSDDPTESAEYEELSGRLASAEEERDDANRASDELQEENSQLNDAVDRLSAEVDDVTEELADAAAERDEVHDELEETRGERNRARQQVRRLREKYDPEIRAELQANVDAAVAKACQAAIDDVDVPIEDVVSYDDSWGPVADENEVIGLVEACAAEERTKTAQQREEERLADCQPVDRGQVERDPEAYDGVCLVMYARIVQFDAATGRCSFHANIAASYSERSYDYDVRSMFGYSDDERASRRDTDCPELDGIGRGDYIQIWATGLGHFRYDTSIGGANTIPSFKIEKVELRRKG